MLHSHHIFETMQDIYNKSKLKKGFHLSNRLRCAGLYNEIKKNFILGLLNEWMTRRNPSLREHFLNTSALTIVLCELWFHPIENKCSPCRFF